ncbi:MAG: hypothetical protein JXR70_08775 [Spirochaetales bacterium]|nr:hypothetical protein [Spirochaetales bacterium]
MYSMETPLKYLDFYSVNDAEHFLGRDDVIQEIFKLVQSYSMVVLCGESGTGKTSLLNAGIIPLLKKNHFHYHRMNDLSRRELARHFKIADNTSIESFNKGLHKFLEKIDGKYILLLDQFEEYLLNFGEQENWLIPDLVLSIDPDKLTIIYSLRSDFLPLFMQWMKHIRQQFYAEQFFYLERFSQDQARLIIKGIMEYYNIIFDYQFLENLIARLATLDESGHIYPPYIQIAAAYFVEHHSSRLTEAYWVEENISLERILSEYFNHQIFLGLEEYEKKLSEDLLNLLVGREGLRRKLRSEEICKRLSESTSMINKITDNLVNRRILRRTDDKRFELIHDFLSKHFFESFSAKEQKQRRYQDMFHQAFQDYKESNIYLDERRIRLFLHHRAALNMDDDTLEFFVRSIVPLFNFGENPYLDLSMKPVLLKTFMSKEDSQRKYDTFMRIKFFMNYDDINMVRAFFMDEKDLRLKSDIFELFSDLNNEEASQISFYGLKEWRNIPGLAIESFLYGIQKFPLDHYHPLLIEIIKNTNSEDIQAIAIESLGYIRQNYTLDSLLSLSLSDCFISPRSYENCFAAVENFLFNNELYYDQYREKVISILAHLIYSAKIENPAVYSLYLKLVKPNMELCQDLYQRIHDSDTRESFISTIGALDNPQLVPFLLEFLKKGADNTVLLNTLASLSAIGKNKAQDELYQCYFETQSLNIQNDILNILNTWQDKRSLQLSREILKNPESDLQIIETALIGLSRFAYSEDFEFMANSIKNEQDSLKNEIFLRHLLNFPESFSDRIISLLHSLWLIKKDELLKLEIACYLTEKGEELCFPYIAEKIKGIDDKFEKQMPGLFTFASSEPVVRLLKSILISEMSFPAGFGFKEILRDLIEHSANRSVAVIGLFSFASCIDNLNDDDLIWLREVMEHGNRPEIRAAALLVLAQQLGWDFKPEIFKQMVDSPWPLVRRAAFFATGLICRGLEDSKRIRVLERIYHQIMSTQDHSIAELAISIFTTFAIKDDVVLLVDLLETKAMSVYSGYMAEKINEAIEAIETIPLESRRITLLRDLFHPSYYYWQEKLRLFPMWFIY